MAHLRVFASNITSPFPSLNHPRESYTLPAVTRISHIASGFDPRLIDRDSEVAMFASLPTQELLSYEVYADSTQYDLKSQLFEKVATNSLVTLRPSGVCYFSCEDVSTPRLRNLTLINIQNVHIGRRLFDYQLHDAPLDTFCYSFVPARTLFLLRDKELPCPWPREESAHACSSWRPRSLERRACGVLDASHTSRVLCAIINRTAGDARRLFVLTCLVRSGHQATRHGRDGCQCPTVDTRGATHMRRNQNTRSLAWFAAQFRRFESQGAADRHRGPKSDLGSSCTSRSIVCGPLGGRRAPEAVIQVRTVAILHRYSYRLNINALAW